MTTDPTKPNMPLMSTVEERVARSLDNHALAQRIDMIHANRRAFTKAEADAFLEEAARRLRWHTDFEPGRVVCRNHLDGLEDA